LNFKNKIPVTFADTLTDINDYLRHARVYRTHCYVLLL